MDIRQLHYFLVLCEEMNYKMCIRDSRGIVDDEVHARGGFQRADVAALAADDAALHFIAGQRHHCLLYTSGQIKVNVIRESRAVEYAK